MTDTKATEEAKGLVAELIKAKQDPKNYNICSDFAIYKGSLVDYKKIKKEFVQVVTEKFETNEEEGYQLAVNVSNFLNLGGFSGSRKNIVKIKDEFFDLDALAKKLNMQNYTKSSAKQTDRSFLTFTRICVAFADECKSFLKKNPSFSRIPELAELGFFYSWACTGINEKEAKEIFSSLMRLGKNWTLASRSNPMRFAEKMEFFYRTTLSYSKKFFDDIRLEYEKK